VSSTDGRLVAVDRGGTFTDVLARAPDGSIVIRKVLSGPDAVARGLAALPPGPVRELRVGSTVATNALLTRLCASAALLVTEGFEDVLRIGHQARPRIFELFVTKTAPLVDRVVEVRERVHVDGTVATSLDEAAVRGALAALAAEGVESLAVAFVHGAMFPDHERRVGAWAREAGIGHVSLSSEICPEVGYVGRAGTAAADAFVGPVVTRWTGALPGDVLLMRSGGGLASRDAFRGVDAVLSGPAGGGVAAEALARSLGLPRVLGFDMGGTSTDVCRWAGETVRRDHLVVAGTEIRVPCLDIHTVAAGGGSILAVRDGRLRVGPDSAGADPGPACYGRGGPATVTDLNVALGRVRPTSFPALFGEDGARPLDPGASRAALEALGPDADPAGFLLVANEAMAAAIGELSTARGHDPRDHALLAFGGAAGQHACAVAALLGITRVVAHPHASVLSAFGISRARKNALRARPLGRPWTDDLPAALAPDVEALAAEARAEVGEPADVEVRWELRYAGSSRSLAARDGADFAARHLRRFGFVRPDRAVEVARVVVEARARAAAAGPAEVPPTDAVRPVNPALLGPAPPVGHPDGRGGVVVLPTPTVSWAALVEGDGLRGPALIEGAATTVVVDPGWTVVVGREGVLHLLHRPAAGLPERARDLRSDPVRLELFHNRFMSIATRMGENLRRTAWSPNIKERLDFSCAVFDARGRLVANAPHIPVHLGAMGETVRSLIHHFEGDTSGNFPAPGDAWAINDPFRGGSHLPDITVISPVFLPSSAAPVAWVASRAHHADVGGVTPGSMPPFSTSLAEEGVRLDFLCIARGGEVLRGAVAEAFGAGPHPARDVPGVTADLEAQIAAASLGVRLIEELFAREGDVAGAFMGHIQANGAAVVRAWAAGLPPGARRFEDRMDDGTPVVVTLAVEAREAGATLVVDFEGTGPASAGNLNAPPAVARAAVLYVLRCLLGRDIPLNEGCLDAVDVRIPADSLLDPPDGAAVVGGNVETSQRVVDVLFGALGVAAAAQGTMNNLTFGNRRFGYYETIGGGAGAGRGRPGAHGVHTHMTNTRITDVEVLETRCPVRLVRFALRAGSGGTGTWPGGDGVVRELEFLEPVRVSLLSERRDTRPFGLDGGGAGAPGVASLRAGSGGVEALGGRFTRSLEPGDRLEVRTPGGGGFGGGVEVL